MSETLGDTRNADLCHLVLIEIFLHGHRWEYIQLIARHFLKSESERKLTILLDPSSLDDPGLKNFVAREGNGRIDVIPIDPDHLLRNLTASRLLTKARQAVLLYEAGRAVRRLRRGAAVDAIFVPYFENFGHLLTLWPVAPFGPVSWGTLRVAARLGLAEHVKGTVGKAKLSTDLGLMRMLLLRPSLRKLFVIRRDLANALQGRKVAYIPDPAEIYSNLTQAAARDALSLPRNSVIIGTFGVIDERKRIWRLLHLLDRLPAKLNVIGFVAGRVYESGQHALQSPLGLRLVASGKLIVEDRFMTNEEEGLFFRAIDIAWVNYNDQLGSSGMLIRAGRYGVPVVASRQGEIGALVAKRELGILDPEDEQVLLCNVQGLIASPALREAIARRLKEEFVDHTPEAFCDPILRAMLEAKTNPTAL